MEASMQRLSSISETIEKAIDPRKTELQLKSMGNGIKNKTHTFEYMFALMFMRTIIRKTVNSIAELSEDRNFLDDLKLIEKIVYFSGDSQ